MREVLAAVLEEGRRAGAWPMASLWVGRGDEGVEAHVGGASAETLWDVASLTKPMVVGTLAMEAVSDGRLVLDEVMAGFEPVGADGLVRDVTPLTWRSLLGHRAGLPAWKDLVFALPEPRVAGSEAARYAVRALVRMAARERDPRRGVEYSDLGFMLLGWLLEERLGVRLNGATAGLGVFCPGERGRHVAPAGWCPWRGREVLLGEVHDPNAWVFGGVAGHAGLFATVAEVGLWGRGLLRRSRGEPSGSPRLDRIRPEVVQHFWDPGQRGFDARGERSSWVLGWDTKSATGSSAGTLMSPDSVGHLGFTGTSVWVDRVRDLVVVLMSNRVALGPTAIPVIKVMRPRVHDAVVRATDEFGACAPS